jgi:transcriptional regulator with XRE-family HTH domain
MDSGALLREVRQRHRLGQDALARRAGTSQAQISRIERGEISPGVATLTRLLAVMGERLELNAVPGPHGNTPTAELRALLEETTPGERVAQAIELSQILTGIAAGRR